MVEHNTNDALASRYTRARRPVMLVHQEKYDTRSAASKREYEIKQMGKKEKLMLFVADLNNNGSAVEAFTILTAVPP